MIDGPYGAPNLGDELILHVIKEQLMQEEIDVVATSLHPEDTQARHGIEATQILEFRKLQISALRQLSKVDALVIGGGQQILEPRIPNPLWGHVARVAHMARRAHRIGKPVFLWGVGVSDKLSPLARGLVRHWIAPFATGTVRDASSLRNITACGVDAPRLSVASDPVFLLPAADRMAGQKLLDRLVGRPGDSARTLLVVPYQDTSADLTYLEELMQGCREAARVLGARIVVQLMDLQAAYDTTLLRHPAVTASSSVAVLPPRQYTPAEMGLLYSAVDVVVATRMHSLIVACTQGTPWVNISRSEKMSELGGMLGVHPLSVKGLARSTVEAAVIDVGRTDRARWQAALAPSLARVRESAAVSSRMFRQQILGMNLM